MRMVYYRFILLTFLFSLIGAKLVGQDAELELAYEIDEGNLRKLEHQRRDLGQTLAQLQEVPK